MGRLALTVLMVTFGCGTARATEIVHFEPLTELRTMAARHAGAAREPALLLEFMAFGRRFRLDLEANARLHALHARLGLGSATVAYRGRLEGRPNSWVRLVRSPQGLTGLISDGEALFGLEAPFDSATAGQETIIFRLKDLHIEAGTLQCGTETRPMTATAMLEHIAADTVATLARQGATHNLNIGAVADYEFVQAFGTHTETALLARFNNVDGIFSAQLGVQITVAATDLFTTEPDPFTATNALELLNELAIYRGRTATQDAQGLTHLFTGRNLDGSTAGIAYVGALCARRRAFDPTGRSFGAGLSEGTRGLTVDSLVAAHEIGHNFGAPHDAEPGSTCESTDAVYLMAATLNGSQQFSQCSIAQMQPEIAAADCLTPIGQPDVLVTGPAVSPDVGIGEPFSYVLRIANEGFTTATAVMVSIELGNGLSWDSSANESTACEVASGTVDCSLAALAGGAETTLALTLSAAAAGLWPLAATVSADIDVNPANNEWSDTVTVRPFVDLGLSASGTTIPIGTTQAIEIQLTNLAPDDATEVELALDASTGLRIDTLSLSGGNCAAASHTASCQLTALGAGMTVTLNLGLTALVAGTQSFMATVGSLQPDQNTADNRVRVSIAVLAPAPLHTGSGGGSAAGLLLAAAACLGMGAGRRRSSRNGGA